MIEKQDYVGAVHVLNPIERSLSMILTEEQEMIRDMAARFSEERLAPYAADWEEKKAYPPEIFEDMAKLGFLGMTLDSQWGGSKTDFISYALALVEIAKGDGGLSTVLSVHNSMTALIIANNGTEEQRSASCRNLRTVPGLAALP